MDKLKGFEVNTKIEIDVDDPDHGGKFLSRVMDFDQKEIKIMAPTDHGILVLFRNKTPISVFYIGDRALYCFNSIVTGHFKEPIPGFSIKYPSKVERIQRREFVRLDIKEHLRYRIIDEKDELGINVEKFQDTYTIDISGGGLCFHSSDPQEIGTSLEIIVRTKELKTESIIGKVVRVKRTDEGNLYEVGVAFEAVSPVVQDKIISWIFDKQRDLRRRGLA